MPLDMDDVADVVAMLVKSAVAPMQERLAVAEAKLAQYAAADQTIADLRERVVVAETKASLMRPDTSGEAYIIRLAEVESKLAAERDTEPLARRITALEAKPEPVLDVSDLRDRVTAVEAKAVAPMVAIDPADFAVLRASVQSLSDLPKDLTALRERVAVVEVRQPVPGPAGKDGANGRDGVDGMGFDEIRAIQDEDVRTVHLQGEKNGRVKTLGTIVLPYEQYQGVGEEGRGYVKGDGVTWGGSEWHCNEPTVLKPGDGTKAWTLKVKRGRDGKDGRDAPGALPVVRS